MPAVTLLLEERFITEAAVLLDLFDAALNIDDGEVTGDDTLSTTHFKVTFNKAPGFPVIGEETEVPVIISLLSGKLAAFQNITAKLLIHRDSEKRATVREVRAMKLSSEDFTWPGLTIQHCTAELTLGEKPVRVTLRSEFGQTTGTFKLFNTVFEFTDSLTFSADGVTGECEATEETCSALRDNLKSLLGDAIRLTKISKLVIHVANNAWTVRLQAAFNVPYFVDGAGELEITASRRNEGSWTVESTILLANSQRWGDPQGWFQIDKPSLSLHFVEKTPDNWLPMPRLGGKITFLPTALERLGGTIADWFGGLFDGMSTEFDCKFEGHLPAIALRPFAPFKLKALEMFELRVPRIDLTWPENNKVNFHLQGVDLRLDIGDVGLRGVIPPLSFDPFTGELTIGKAHTLSLDLSLSAPGGVKGSARVEYVDNQTLRYLQGRGQLSTPTLPGVAVAFRVGQFRADTRDAWTPTVLLYADAPVMNPPLPLFPFVYVQQIGLGVGVNCEVQGTSRLTLAEARKRVQKGLPDASDPNVWTPSKGTPLTLLARLFLGPTGTNEAPGFYAADMTLIVTSDAQATAFGKLWLYTSVADARTGDFQQRPAGLALMLLDAQEPSLRIAAQTTGNGLTSLKSSGLSGQLMGFDLPPMRLALEATKNSIALYLGPNKVSGSLGPLSVRGTSLLAFRARFDRDGMSYAISHSSLSAGFNWSASVSDGLISLSASFSARFAAELLLLGTFSYPVKDKPKFLVYGSASIAMNAALSLHTSVGFSITIDCLFDSYTISWSVDYDFRMEVHVDLGLEAALTTGSEGLGLRGHATAGVSVLGINATLTVPVAVNTAAIDEARREYVKVDNDIKTILGI